QGIANVGGGPVLAARNGSVWVGTSGGLTRWNQGEVTIYRKGSGKTGRGAREISGSGLADSPVECLFQDSRGRIWIATLGGFGYLENGGFVPISAVPSGPMYSIAGDADGSLWIAHQDRGLLHVLRDGAVEQIPWARLGRKDFGESLAVDPVQGGLWIAFF